jgi:arsenite-transporting ATPase
LSLIDKARDHARNSHDAGIYDLLQVRRRTFLVAREQLLDQTTTAFLLVANTDKLSILESRNMTKLLAQFNVAVWGVVINQVLPDHADGAFLSARRQRDQTYRHELDQEFGHLPRAVVPLLEQDAYGISALKTIGELLRTGWQPQP